MYVYRAYRRKYDITEGAFLLASQWLMVAFQPSKMSVSVFPIKISTVYHIVFGLPLILIVRLPHRGRQSHISPEIGKGLERWHFEFVSHVSFHCLKNKIITGCYFFAL